MTQKHRVTRFASLFASALLIAACGGTPEVSHGGTGPDAGNNETGGGDGNSNGGGPQLDLDAGQKPPPGSVAGESGASGDTEPVCGDGRLEPPESCDDGNAKPGDGCSGVCKLEKNWKCPNPGKPCKPSETPAVCGNGEVETGETCDLGKNASGKSLNDGKSGCDELCQTVSGWTCPGNGEPCTQDAYCGDGIVSSTLGEQCDDGKNDAMHGCDTDCTKMPGWRCPPTGGACMPDVGCGNGKVEGTEECDDKNLADHDGCSSSCYTETGFTCPPTGGRCERTCGNGKIDSGETCDDGNRYGIDGCSDKCKIQPGYSCPHEGQPCLYTPPPPPPVCGDGKQEGSEACDDGNIIAGDGCSSTCVVEAGWKCPTANAACIADKCGDKILAGNEQCDDGNTVTGDGCTPSCTVEPNAVCPANGGTCIPMVCGDGNVTGTEQCDTGGQNDGKHGCSASCQLVNGWVCPLAGKACTEVCGDGIIVGDEQCDEKGDVACCSASCRLKPGYVCDPSKNPHSQPATPYCGNGTVNGPSNANSTIRGSEQCDDGNTIPFDGCSPTCTNEPLCGTLNTYLANPTPTTYQCFARCGDGLVLPPEQCDDGNTVNGDGCDSSCKVELIPGGTAPAWTCSQPPPGALVTLPVIWRDFSPRSHPQFSIDPRDNRRLPGIPQNTLKQVNVGGARPYRYVPAYNTAFVSPNFGTYKNVAGWTMNGPGWVSGSEGFQAPPWMNNPPAYDLVWWADQAATLTNNNANPLLTPAGRFAQWYLDDASVNKSFASSITLTGSNGSYQYSCDNNGCDSAFPGNPSGFYPLDGKGWVASGGETARNGGHNYSFTTESRSWFAFKGGEQLAFYGDDDLWVFVNGQLTLDIGGIHQKLQGNFTLNSNGNATSCVENTPGDGGQLNNCTTINLGLTLNGIYEIAIFNAEREVIDSNFQLTLTGFNSAPSVCTPICGDNYVVGSEQCDRGNQNVAPGANTYGKCTTECKLGPYCGDNALQKPPEVCDNSLNIDAYVNQTPVAPMCAPGCLTPAYCGDGTTQKIYGEQCDDGTANNQNTYGHCQVNCKLGPRCGDHTIQAANGETCDDGANNGSASSACDASCKLKCGNGHKEAGEACDDGTANGSAGSTCTTLCQLKCGNGILEAGEECDDGKNDGSYGGCNSDCTYAPYCGDGNKLNPPEFCDNGADNSSSAYGPSSCTDECLPGGYCGDGIVNGKERCDDGTNSGKPGSCKSDCSAYVPGNQCGDGKIQAPETCDDGKAVNGTDPSKCDAQCRFKCGNASIDKGETCDDGVNDGSYGGCTPTCTLAGYCGDGKKNGNEQCDAGNKNVDLKTAYGMSVCTTACRVAPFCGDGKVQGGFDEECEGNDNCMNCKFVIPK